MDIKFNVDCQQCGKWKKRDEHLLNYTSLINWRSKDFPYQYTNSSSSTVDDKFSSNFFHQRIFFD
jgi:hypothetical protein